MTTAKRTLQLLAAAMVCWLAMLATIGSPADAATGSFVPPKCKDPSSSGALRVSGNRILTASGKPFTFYGLSTYGGLQNQVGSKLWTHALASARAQIEAAPHWNVNTVRIQVTGSNLFTRAKRGQPVNVSVLKDLCSEVQLARREGLEVVLNYQVYGSNYDQRLPTARTEQFWRYIGEIYANQPGIIFDPFNEPRLYYKQEPAAGSTKPALNLNWIWQTWRDGGAADSTRYVGMQSMVNLFRDRHWNNIIWIESPFYDDALNRYSSYALKGSNLVLSFHHPYLAGGPSEWQTAFGYLASKYPLVDGEWSQYSGNKPECQASAYKMAPEFLAYLKSINVGLIAWSLQAGALTWDTDKYVPTNLTQARDTTDPNALYRPDSISSNFSCASAQAGQGVGQLVFNYFQLYSRP